MQGRLKQINIYHTFFTLSEKKPPANLEKWQEQRPFSPVCLLLLQRASMNAFYSL